MEDDRAWADAPIFGPAWEQERRHRFGPLCQTPGCGRIPKGGLLYCCKECRDTRGRKHNARCHCEEDTRRLHSEPPVDLRSPSPTPTLPLAPPRFTFTVSTRSRSRSRSPRSPTFTFPIAHSIVRSNAQGQAERAPSVALLHGYGDESGPTSTIIEPDAAPTPTSRAVDVPSVELLHGDGVESAPTPAASSDERETCAICNERMRWSGGQTVILNCGHAYCMHCWQRLLETCALAVRCPQCRAPAIHVIPMYV